MSILIDSFYSSTLSTFHVLYIIILAILAKKLKYVQHRFEYSLSKLVTNIIIPCFIFSQIINNFRINRLRLITETMIGCVFVYTFGLIIGFIISKFLTLNNNQSCFLAAIFSTPHTTSITVILIQIIGPVLDTFIKRKSWLTGTATERAYLYIAMNSIYSNIWRWSGAYYLIESENKGSDTAVVVIDEALITKDLEDMNKKAIIDNNTSSCAFNRFIRSIINTPIITAVITMCITLSPTVQSYFTTSHSILNETFVSVNIMVSKSYSFVCIFMFGLSVAEAMKCGNDDDDNNNNSINSDECIFTGWELFWLAIMKLIVMPLLACPFIIYIFRSWLHSDDMLVFIYLFMVSAPSAINLVIICTYKQAYVKTISMFMIVVYGIAIITMTLQVTFFIYVLGILNAGNAITTATPTTPVNTV